MKIQAPFRVCASILLQHYWTLSSLRVKWWVITQWL
jgi:hypothetical protein